MPMETYTEANSQIICIMVKASFMTQQLKPDTKEHTKMVNLMVKVRYPFATNEYIKVIFTMV
jgi:hypothetical protein